jgi:hypothetical protein
VRVEGQCVKVEGQCVRVEGQCVRVEGLRYCVAAVAVCEGRGAALLHCCCLVASWQEELGCGVGRNSKKCAVWLVEGLR